MENQILEHGYYSKVRARKSLL